MSLTPDCGTTDHWNRRTLLKAAGLSGMSWLTPMADQLAVAADRKPENAKAVIVLWMQGGASQLDTFDPHPGKPIAYGTKAINTSLKGVQFAEGLAQTAEMMNDLAVVRSVISREGDHERAYYNLKTGFRPDPSIVHPSIGSVVCHQFPNAEIDIPTHISILPGNAAGRGGYLGAQFDAFKVNDPIQPVPDTKAYIDDQRQVERFKNLDIVEQAFRKGRGESLDSNRTLHQATMKNARAMMTSEQLAAFDIKEVPKAVKEPFGDHRFGRGCLAAVRLVEAGVRCVEVTLGGGWDSHLNNNELQRGRVDILDPALASLLKLLKERDLFDSTVVLCGTEFGRTPKQNPADGRDHWPHGFSIAMAGGGIKGGRVIGETDPEGEKEKPAKPIMVADIHATIYDLLGIDFEKKHQTPVKRPMSFSDGFPIDELLI